MIVASMQLLETCKSLFFPRRANNHRPRFLYPKTLFFLSLLLVGTYQSIGLFAAGQHSFAQGGLILGYASNITTEAVITQTNSMRTGQGIGTLAYSDTLSQAAAAKARDMFANNYWAHTSPTGREPWDFIRGAGYTYRVAGENLARDFDSTQPMVSAWMNSPTHRANILNPRYQEIGIAVVNGSMHGVETTLVVQMFAAPIERTAQQAITEAAAETVTVPAAVVAEAETPVADVENPVVESEQQAVLAQASVPAGELQTGILYSPKLLLRVVLLSMFCLVLVVLAYDALVIGHRRATRIVGKNLAHIMLLLVAVYLVLVFKTGVIDL